MSTQELASTNNLQRIAVNYEKNQYTLWQILGIWLAAGAPMWLLGWVAYPALSAGLPSLVMGTANGYANIMMITWLQQKVAPELMGRIMSLVMFAAIGLNPVSTALAGALIGVNATLLLVCADILMRSLPCLQPSAPLFERGWSKKSMWTNITKIALKGIAVMVLNRLKTLDINTASTGIFGTLCAWVVPPKVAAK